MVMVETSQNKKNRVGKGIETEMKLDLHVHTTASDGQYAPEEIIAMAKKLQLEAVAITDHDTIDGIKEAREAAADRAVNMVAGIEISTMDVEEVHMLGLGIDESCEPLKKACEQYEQERLGRGKRICEFLEKKSIPVDWEELLAIAGEGSVGRPHFAEYLLRHGYVKTKNEAFTRYLDTKEFHRGTDRKLPAPEEAIALIHQAGGVSVLAHPGLLRLGGWELEEFLKRLVMHGLDGIECIYSRHNAKQVKTFLGLAQKYGLGISAGSDFHGERVKPDVTMGMEIEEWMANMLIIANK